MKSQTTKYQCPIFLSRKTLRKLSIVGLAVYALLTLLSFHGGPVPLETPQIAQIEDKEQIRPFVQRIVYGYTSEISQTDGSPCISASGDNICELWQGGQSICAANFVPLGTVLIVEDLGKCLVLDRMNARFPDAVDWYFGYNTAKALQFGKKTLSVWQ